MNINDPAGVKALLDQLRSSQAWQETLVPTLDIDVVDDVDGNSNVISSSSTPSVATLLSQLQSSSTSNQSSLPNSHPPGHVDPPANILQSAADRPAQKLVTPVPSQQDVKSYTFQQALPHLARLSEDPNLVRSITQMKQQQAELERQLSEERQTIQKKYEEKVRIARTKATMIGTVLTKREADTLNHAFRTESRKFDVERVLPAWDGIIIKQQAILESAAVPTMFVTDVPKDRERQQKVIQVLEGITG